MTIGLVGRMVAEKGLRTLVESAEMLSGKGFDFRLKFVGDGPERAAIESLIDETGLRSRTIFTGYLTGDAFAAATADVSVVVIPTISEETFGLTALEQMACGRLVVASDIGGLAEVVDCAGLKFRPGDAAALAEQLRSVLENPGIIEEYRVKAQRRAEYFSLDRMIARHIETYREILDVRRSAN